MESATEAALEVASAFAGEVEVEVVMFSGGGLVEGGMPPVFGLGLPLEFCCGRRIMGWKRSAI